MKNSVLLIWLLSSFHGLTQNINHLAFDTVSRKMAIDLRLDGELSTQSISNRFLFPLAFGGYIDRETLQKVASKQGDLSRFGGYIDPEISVSLFDVKPFKSKDWGVRFQAGMIATGAARVSGALAGIAMVGNEPYLNQKIGLLGQAVELFSAHKIGFGLVDPATKSSVMLNAYGIQSYMKGGLNDGTMQFNSGGDLFLSMDGAFSFAHSNAYYVGAGVGLDASFNLNVGKDGKETYFNFSVKNLGVGILNNPQSRYTVDSSWNYNGFTGDELTHLDEKLDDLDGTLQDLGFRKTEGAKVVFMPMQVHIGKLINESLNKPWQFTYGIRVYVQNAAIPLLYAGAQWRANNWLRVGGGLNYGGYGLLRGNVYVQGIWDKVVAGIYFNNVVGLTNAGNGIGANISVGYRINK